MSDRKIQTKLARRRSAVLPIALLAALVGASAYAVTSLVAHQTVYHQVNAGITTQFAPDGITTQ